MFDRRLGSSDGRHRADQVLDAHEHARLLLRLTNSRFLRCLAVLNRTAGQAPSSPVVVLLDQKHATGPVKDDGRCTFFRHPFSHAGSLRSLDRRVRQCHQCTPSSRLEVLVVLAVPGVGSGGCAYPYGCDAPLYPHVSQLSNRFHRACLGGVENAGAVEPAAGRRGGVASAGFAPALAVVHPRSRRGQRSGMTPERLR
jgi:hypothetical protein